MIMLLTCLYHINYRYCRQKLNLQIYLIQVCSFCSDSFFHCFNFDIFLNTKGKFAIISFFIYSYRKLGLYELTQLPFSAANSERSRLDVGKLTRVVIFLLYRSWLNRFRSILRLRWQKQYTLLLHNVLS